MNYEQKYKKVLEQAKQAIENIPDKSLISWLENIFPELRESEDERIRKALIENFSNMAMFSNWGAINKIQVSDIIAWLEKQGEKSSWSEEDEYQINTILHGLDLKRELYKKEGNQVEEKRYKAQYDWLKSFKPQTHWKPSEEQMEALAIAVHDAHGHSIYKKLFSIYNDLKNL